MTSRTASAIFRALRASNCKVRACRLIHTSPSARLRIRYLESSSEERKAETNPDPLPSVGLREIKDHGSSSDDPKAEIGPGPLSIKQRKPYFHPDLLAEVIKPAALPYVVGTDICHIPRIKRILDKQYIANLESHGKKEMPALWTRVLTPLEEFHSSNEARPNEKTQVNFLAGRWAAKEAIIKACTMAYPELRRVFMNDIVVLAPSLQRAAAQLPSAESGVVAVGQRGEDVETLRGPPRAFVRLGKRGGKTTWREVGLSISHDGDYATAVALVTVDPALKLEAQENVESAVDIQPEIAE